MGMRHGILVLWAIAGLTLGGCGKADNTPPPDVEMDTPDVVIDDGSQVSPDEIGTEDDSAGKTDDASGADDKAKESGP